MTTILNIILFVVVLTTIVSIHELGHYLFAKRAGILCHEFSIGMGPALYSRKKHETAFSIRALPIGGFVAMSGEQSDGQAEFIKKGDVIGLKFDENQKVTHLVLEPSVKSDVLGKVIDFDLIGKEGKQLYITLESKEGTESKYEVLRNALYDGGKKGQIQITPYERSYANKTKLERFLVLFAGPAMNIILAFVILFLVSFFMTKPVAGSTKVQDIAKGSALDYANVQVGTNITHIGDQPVSIFSDIVSAIYNKQDDPLRTTVRTDNGEERPLTLGLYLQTIGITNVADNNIYYEQAIIGQSFGRAKQHLQIRDQIIKMKTGQKEATITNWNDVLTFAKTISNETEIEITVLRDAKEVVAKYDLISKGAIEKLGSSAIVLQLGIVQESKFDLGYSLSYPFKKMWRDVSQMGITLGLLFNPTEKIGIGDLSGPIGIFSLVSDAAAGGIITLLVFTAFLSINIGLLNLLPIPALDGGQILFLGIEAVTKKKVPHKVANIINNITFYALLGLIIFVSYNDILRLFS